MKTVLVIGEPFRISVGRISAEEKGDLLLKQELYLDEGLGERSVFEINDLFEEYGLDFETMDLEFPGQWGLDVEGLKKQAVYLSFTRPERGDFLVFKRYVISSEEFAGKVIFPFEEVKPEALSPLVFDFDAFCGAGTLLVGFFYLHEEPERLRSWLQRELQRVPAKAQGRFLRELEAAFGEGRLPHGPKLPGQMTFHGLLPLEADFEERYEAYVMEARPGEVECFGLEVIPEKPILEP